MRSRCRSPVGFPLIGGRAPLLGLSLECDLSDIAQRSVQTESGFRLLPGLYLQVLREDPAARFGIGHVNSCTTVCSFGYERSLPGVRGASDALLSPIRVEG